MKKWCKLELLLPTIFIINLIVITMDPTKLDLSLPPVKKSVKFNNNLKLLLMSVNVLMKLNFVTLVVVYLLDLVKLVLELNVLLTVIAILLLLKLKFDNLKSLKNKPLLMNKPLLVLKELKNS